MKRLQLAVAALALLIACTANAIPPPWTIEEAKAKAKLVVIAKIGKIEPVQSEKLSGQFNRRTVLQPIQILKGKPADATGYLLFREPVHQGGNIQRRQVGGAGQPKIRQGETALIFLSTHPKSNDFIVRGGSFGYIVLNADSKDELAEVEKQLAGYARTCKNIKDDKVRAQLEGYYAAALEFVKKEADKIPADK